MFFWQSYAFECNGLHKTARALQDWRKVTQATQFLVLILISYIPFLSFLRCQALHFEPRIQDRRRFPCCTNSFPRERQGVSQTNSRLWITESTGTRCSRNIPKCDLDCSATVEDKLEVKIRYWTIMKILQTPTDAFWQCHSTPRHKLSTASRISSLEISWHKSNFESCRSNLVQQLKANCSSTCPVLKVNFKGGRIFWKNLQK